MQSQNDEYHQRSHLHSPPAAAHLVIAASLVLSGSVMPVSAQIPMMEEFNQGSGSKVMSTNKPGVVGGKIIREDTIKGTVVESEKTLSNLKDIVKKEEWESILNLRNKLKVVLTKNFAIQGGIKGLANELKVPVDTAEQIESTREELFVAFNSISEYALSHRIIVFNSEDLKGIEQTQTRSLTTPEEISEQIGNAEETVKIMNELVGQFGGL